MESYLETALGREQGASPVSSHSPFEWCHLESVQLLHRNSSPSDLLSSSSSSSPSPSPVTIIITPKMDLTLSSSSTLSCSSSSSESLFQLKVQIYHSCLRQKQHIVSPLNDTSILLCLVHRTMPSNTLLHGLVHTHTRTHTQRHAYKPAEQKMQERKWHAAVWTGPEYNGCEHTGGCCFLWHSGRKYLWKLNYRNGNRLQLL